MTKKSRKASCTKTKAINNIEDINVNNILVSRKEPCGNKNTFKCFIGYYDNDIIISLVYKASTNDWIC